MQLAEFLLLTVLALGVARAGHGAVRSLPGYAVVLTAGIAVLLVGGLTAGWRWQLYPAILGIALLSLGLLRQGPVSRALRVTGTAVLLLLGLLSGFLALQFPLLKLPEPAGPYGVGTFDYTLVDGSRQELYDPARPRELQVEVWYPADTFTLDAYSASTLYHELYETGGDWISLASGYLRKVKTHSFPLAPLADAGRTRFPVLLFNHAQASFTAQNQLLMEHLASHGYVVFSISHPYDSLKVNLSDSRVVRRSAALPADMPRDFLSAPGTQLMTGVLELSDNDYREFSRVLGLIKQLGRELEAAGPDEREERLEAALHSEALEPYEDLVSPQDLESYLLFTTQYQDTKVRHWVEDTRFVADSLLDMRYPLNGFEQALDVDRLGVFGMSFGGAVAGEFCRIDARCKAGANYDGTQFGAHWDEPLQAPFLMLYSSDTHGMNDFAYPAGEKDYWEWTVPGSRHVDFTDAPYVAPFVKTIGLSGRIDAGDMTRLLNALQLQFFDYYLKGQALPGDPAEAFPGLELAASIQPFILPTENKEQP